ncbi:MAG: hypothetical protein IJ647_10765, partial [Prevotella sp.]|nr:hypothetical protein [Prevotella sp.]
MAGDAWAAAEQQLVAFEGRGAVEVGVAGTGLTEQVLGNEAAQIHRLLILTEPLHQLFAANTFVVAGTEILGYDGCYTPVSVPTAIYDSAIFTLLTGLTMLAICHAGLYNRGVIEDSTIASQKEIIERDKNTILCTGTLASLKIISRN